METSNKLIFFITLISLICVIVLSTLNLLETNKSNKFLKENSIYKSNVNFYDYKQIENDLFNGRRLRFIFHYKKMNLYINEELQPFSPDAIGGFDVKKINYFGSIFS